MKSGMRLRFEVIVPAEFETDVLRDLEARGASVARKETHGVIRGEVPADALEGYGGALRALTAGRGTFRADPSRP